MDEFEVKVEPKKKNDIWQELMKDPEWYVQIKPYVDWLDSKLGFRFWALVAVVLVSVFAGTPHILVTYQCYGSCSRQNAVEFDCDYFGIWGWTKAEPDEATRRCARFLLL